MFPEHNSAFLSEYLLEKSRVTGRNPDEQNYHFFYYLFAGASDARKKARPR